MKHDLPPILKLAERVTVEIERAVQTFARKYRHDYGADLRREAMECWRLAQRAWRDPKGRSAWLQGLVWKVDDLNLQLQLGKQLNAFASFGQWESIIRISEELGRQAGGWFRQQHPKGQSPARTQHAQPERAQTRSSHAASPEAIA